MITLASSTSTTDDGPVSPAGATGPTGPTGQTGPTGPVGPTGSIAESTATTLDASGPTVLTFTPPDNAITVYELWAVGATSSLGISYRRTFGVRVVAGTPAVLGGGFAGGEQGEDGAISSATLGVGVTGGDIRITAVGVAATEIDWSLEVFQKRSVPLVT